MTVRKYHHGDLRRGLVEAGLAILEEGGLDALTLRACAARAGVSHAAPRNHFAGLPGLVAAIRAEGFRRHAASMREGMDAAPDRPGKLIGALHGYMAFARAHPALYKLMFTMGEPVDWPELAEAAEQSFAVLVEISEGLDWPHAGKVPGNINTQMMVWSFAHGLADLTINGQFAAVECGAGALPPPELVFPGFGYRR
jgi:AcrR family transcriptional regulator